MRHIAHRETFHSNQQAFLIFFISIFFEKRLIFHLWMGIFFSSFVERKFIPIFQRISKMVIAFSLCCYHLPLKRLNKVKIPLPRMFVPSLVQVDTVVMENIFQCCQCIFPIALLFPLGFECTRILLTQDMCRRIGPSRSGETWFSNVVSVLCRYHFPLENGLVLHVNKYEPPSPKKKNVSVILEMKMDNRKKFTNRRRATGDQKRSLELSVQRSEFKKTGSINLHKY